MKKRLWIIMTAILVVGVLGACGKASADAGTQETNDEKKNEISEPTENQFDATVLEILDDYIMVEALEEQDIVGEVRVQTGLLTETEMPELKEGDVVRVTHDGKMTMSLPPQMTAVELIKISK